MKESREGYDAIEAYLSGKKTQAIKLSNGDIKIPLKDGEYVLLPFKNNLDRFVKTYRGNNSTKSSTTVEFVGEISNPGYPISSTICAPKTGPANHTFTLSSSFSYEISGSVGIDIRKFEAGLVTTLKRSYTISDTISYTIPKDRCATIYGSETYNKYVYEKKKKIGKTKKATLLEPVNYLIYVIVR